MAGKSKEVEHCGDRGRESGNRRDEDQQKRVRRLKCEAERTG